MATQEHAIRTPWSSSLVEIVSGGVLPAEHLHFSQPDPDRFELTEFHRILQTMRRAKLAHGTPKSTRRTSLEADFKDNDPHEDFPPIHEVR